MDFDSCSEHYLLRGSKALVIRKRFQEKFGGGDRRVGARPWARPHFDRSRNKDASCRVLLSKL